MRKDNDYYTISAHRYMSAPQKTQNKFGHIR